MVVCLCVALLQYSPYYCLEPSGYRLDTAWNRPEHIILLLDAILMMVMCYSHSTDGATSAKKVQSTNLMN